jgi:hypothetical protein
MEDIQPQKEQISIQFTVCRKEFKAYTNLNVANNGEEKTRTSCSERLRGEPFAEKFLWIAPLSEFT